MPVMGISCLGRHNQNKDFPAQGAAGKGGMTSFRDNFITF